MVATLPGDQGCMLLLEGCIEGSKHITPSCNSTSTRFRLSFHPCSSEKVCDTPGTYVLLSRSSFPLRAFSPTSCFCHTRLSLSVSAINLVTIEIETPYSSMPYHSYLITCQAAVNSQRNSWSINPSSRMIAIVVASLSS